MRASLLAAVVALAAVFLYWRYHRAEAPAALPRAQVSAQAPNNATSESRSAAEHRSGAVRSMRGSTSATRSDSASNPVRDTDATNAVSAPATAGEAVERRAGLPAAAPGGVVEKSSAAAAADSGTAPKSAPHAATPPASVANARTAAPATATPSAPKTTAELFAPLIEDNPNQVFAPPTVNYHAAVQGETVDPDWGPAASDALRSYITSTFGTRFEIPSVDCRQDLCELQVASLPGHDGTAEMHDLITALNQVRQQPWWTALGFDQEYGTSFTMQDGRSIALWFFSRR